MFHNTIQVNSSEMYPSSRGASLGIHAFFVFIGQSLGIYFFSKVFNLLDYSIGFCFSAITILMLGFYFSNQLNKIWFSQQVETPYQLADYYLYQLIKISIFLNYLFY